MLDVYPDNPSKNSPPSLPEMEVVGDPHQTDDHTWLGLRRSAGVKTSMQNTLSRNFVPN